MISILDTIEESRPLTRPEFALREIIVRLLSRIVKEKLLLWKQRSKIRAAIDGDENTRYFHACASQRLRHNKIQVLDHDGMELFGHEQKARLLYDFYNSLLGASCQTNWRFDLNSLYPKSRAFPLSMGLSRRMKSRLHFSPCRGLLAPAPMALGLPSISRPGAPPPLLSPLFLSLSTTTPLSLSASTDPIWFCSRRKKLPALRQISAQFVFKIVL